VIKVCVGSRLTDSHEWFFNRELVASLNAVGNGVVKTIPIFTRAELERGVSDAILERVFKGLADAGIDEVMLDSGSYEEYERAYEDLYEIWRDGGKANPEEVLARHYFTADECVEDYKRLLEVATRFGSFSFQFSLGDCANHPNFGQKLMSKRIVESVKRQKAVLLKLKRFCKKRGIEAVYRLKLMATYEHTQIPAFRYVDQVEFATQMGSIGQKDLLREGVSTASRQHWWLKKHYPDKDIHGYGASSIVTSGLALLLGCNQFHSSSARRKAAFGKVIYADLPGEWFLGSNPERKRKERNRDPRNKLTDAKVVTAVISCGCPICVDKTIEERLHDLEGSRSRNREIHNVYQQVLNVVMYARKVVTHDLGGLMEEIQKRNSGRSRDALYLAWEWAERMIREDVHPFFTVDDLKAFDREVLAYDEVQSVRR